MRIPRNLREELLFATPLYSGEIPDSEALNSRLRKAIDSLVAESSGITRSNRNGWHSDTDIFGRQEPAFSDLGRLLVAGMQLVLNRSSSGTLGKDLRLRIQGWINVNPRGAYNAPHDHPGYQWSGCYYVHVPDSAHQSSGKIEFLDHRTSLGNLALLGSHFRSKVSRRPKAGEFLVFPSYLRHWVYPNEEDEERISIAFNIRVMSPDRDEDRR